MTLDHNRFKVTRLGGYADVNVNFYGIGPNAGERGVSVNMVDKGALGLAQYQYRIARNLYVGPRFQFMKINSQIKRESPMFPDLNLPKSLLDSRISGPRA